MTYRSAFILIFIAGCTHLLFAQSRGPALKDSRYSKSFGDAQRLEFTPNRGQCSDQYHHAVPDVLFVTESGGVSASLTKHSMRFVFRRDIHSSAHPAVIPARLARRSNFPDSNDSILFYRVDVEF